MARASALDTDGVLSPDEGEAQASGFVMVDTPASSEAGGEDTLRWPQRIDEARKTMDEGQFGEARKLLLDALQLKPNDPLCRAMLAHCTAALDSNSLESLPMAEAAARDARRPEVLYHLGSVHLLQENRRKAIQVLNDALSIDPRYVPILALLEKIGRRKPPVIPFLSRDNSLNIRLGKLLTRMGKR